MNTSQFLTLQKLALSFLMLMHVGCSWFISEKNIENTELKTSYYQNGNIEYESEYKNGNLHGVTKYWDESENLISEATYSNGKLHGLWTSFFSGGSVKSIVNYSKIVKLIKKLVKNKHYNFLETLAEDVFDELFKDKRIDKITLQIEKLEIIKDCSSVGIQISKKRSHEKL